MEAVGEVGQVAEAGEQQKIEVVWAVVAEVGAKLQIEVVLAAVGVVGLEVDAEVQHQIEVVLG